MYTLIFSLFQSVSAASLSDVTIPDEITLQNDVLQLNGLGLREKYWIDIYVAGLYLPTKMTDGPSVINAKVSKRIHIEFVYSDVPKEKMVEVLEENIQNNKFSLETIAYIRQCGSWMQDFTTGDTVVFDYIPSTQTTTIYINGTSRGSITSEDFMKAIFAMYVGKYPATEALKKGLLGK